MLNHTPLPRNSDIAISKIDGAGSESRADATARQSAKAATASQLGRSVSDLPDVLTDALAEPGKPVVLDYLEVVSGIAALRKADGYKGWCGFYPLDDLRPSRQACLLLAHIDGTSASILAARDATALKQAWKGQFIRINADDTVERKRAAQACGALLGLFALSLMAKAPPSVVDGLGLATAASIGAFYLTISSQTPTDKIRSGIEMDTAEKLRERLSLLSYSDQ